MWHWHGYHGMHVMTATATQCNLPSSGNPLANHLLTLTSLTNQQVIWRSIITCFYLLSVCPYVSSSSAGTELHLIKSFPPACSRSPATVDPTGGELHAGKFYTAPQYVNKLYERYLSNDYLFNICPQSHPKMPQWPLVYIGHAHVCTRHLNY